MKYNIPVTVWLSENYPLKAPIVYVNPTSGMIIKPGHTHVNASGLVATPYFQHWSYPGSNLVDMASDMSITFGQVRGRGSNVADPYGTLFIRPQPMDWQQCCGCVLPVAMLLCTTVTATNAAHDFWFVCWQY